MRLMQKVLLAADLRDETDEVVRVAAAVGKAFDSEIVLLHVMPSTSAPSAVVDMAKRKIAELLAELAERIRAEGVEVGETITASGVPFDEIIEHADDQDVNLIIMGSGEDPGKERAELGMTARRVLRRARKPVLVVKRGSPLKLEKLLCPVDFSETSGRALANAIHVARTLRAELIVLTVVQPLSALLPAMGDPGEDAQQAHVQKQEKEFDRFLRDFDFHDVRWRKELRQGQPHTEILGAVREIQPELLFMGSVGRTGLSRMLLGSVAEKVTWEIPCSVVILKSEEVVRLQLISEIDDIESHVKQGQKLLEKGFAKEALREFKRCIGRDMMYAPAWEGSAAAYERLGNDKQAEECRQRAKEIVQHLWDRRLEAEVRSDHMLWRRR